MLGCKIKAKEIKRLPSAGKANSTSAPLCSWSGEGSGGEGALPFLPRPGSPSLWVALGTCSSLWASVPKLLSGRGAELEREHRPGLPWGLTVWPPEKQSQCQQVTRLEMQTLGSSPDLLRWRTGRGGRVGGRAWEAGRAAIWVLKPCRGFDAQCGSHTSAFNDGNNC